MKSITLSMILIFATLTASPSSAGSGTENNTDQPSAWSRFWQDVTGDWKKIGNDAKETGTEAGRTVKKEFQEMPENIRKGIEETKQDLKNDSGSPEKAPRRDN